jgi:hypothetical protein
MARNQTINFRGRRIFSPLRLAVITMGLAAPAWLSTQFPALAAEPGGLALTSNGSLGDISSNFIYNYISNQYTLNTNNGDLYQGNTFVAPLASSVVTQSDGSQVRVWDFSTFTVAQGLVLNVTGSLPGAIVASGDITVNGAINVSAGGGAGAIGAGIYAPGNAAPGSTGGGGGLMFVTPGNFSIGNAGSITADGENGPFYDEGAGGAGGGGAGMLWFNAGGVFTNDGTIFAEGGAAGQADGCCTTAPSFNSGEGGAGAGGLVVIDPSEIINNGLIDVADGNGLTTNGGDVVLSPDLVTGDGAITGQAQIPEPSGIALLSIGLAAIAFGRFRTARRGLPV